MKETRMSDGEVTELFRGIKIKVGLRQQGHIPTVQFMLSQGATWEEIGKVIGWDGRTAEYWYRLDQRHEHDQ